MASAINKPVSTRLFAMLLIAMAQAIPSAVILAADSLPPIEEVEIAANQAILVNGQPFFPLMAWLQDARNFDAVKACGMNTVAGYYQGASGTKDVTEYFELVEKAGLYGVMPFDSNLIGNSKLLGYIHDDEPDLQRIVSDAEIVPAKQLRINRKTPLWKLIDGETHSWSVLDPLEGASLTIKLKRPITVESFAVWLTVSGNLPLAKEVSFEGDGKKLTTVMLEPKKGQQKFRLPAPATFSKLKMTVNSTVAGNNVWGSIGEIEAFDAAGKNLLLSPPRTVPKMWPAEALERYKEIKAADASRPVFMTLTGNFHPHFKKWSESQRLSIYPQYCQAADVLGYDIYPIYGWNKPKWIHLVQEATAMLAKMAGKRPVYVWIETSKGGQYTGPLERQKDVTPAHIKAEVWMSITRGATAIGYFTHIWKPSYNQFGVPEENRKALRSINDQITRLAPAILAEQSATAVGVETEGDVKVDLMAKQHNGKLYVFAVNYDEQYKATTATIRVAGLASREQVTVVDENRTIRSDSGSFTDTFEPLAVHIYEIDAKR